MRTGVLPFAGFENTRGGCSSNGERKGEADPLPAPGVHTRGGAVNTDAGAGVGTLDGGAEDSSLETWLSSEGDALPRM